MHDEDCCKFLRPATKLVVARFNNTTKRHQALRRCLRTLKSLLALYSVVHLYIGEGRLHLVGVRTRLLPISTFSHILLTLLTLDSTA
jgi:hypothetical protein